MEKDHIKIRQGIINASYKAIDHLQEILKEPILREDFKDELGPEKFLNALKAKKQAQTDAFQMLDNIESANSLIQNITDQESGKQKRVNNSSRGFSELRAEENGV